MSKHPPSVSDCELQTARTINEMEFDRFKFPLGRTVDADSAFRSLYRVDVGGVPDVSEIHATSILDDCSCMFWSNRLTGRRLEHMNAQLPYSLRPWRWSRNMPPKCRLTFNRLHGVVTRPSPAQLVFDSESRRVSSIY